MERHVMVHVVSMCMLGMVVTSSSCSSSPKQWYKPGATHAMFRQDKEWCENALLVSPESMSSQFYTFEECMEKKGWTQVDTSP